MSDCNHDCKKTAEFPKKIFNRPALDKIEYRIGSYSTIREHLLDQLNNSAILSAWSHRGADDPGIALLEGTAIVGDVLTFYQNRYSNEAFLRTADWKESVSELVQLTGYRLAPGVGGETTFAVKVKAKDDEAVSSVTIPKGFGFKAQVENKASPDGAVSAEFESKQAILAYAHLSEFELYHSPKPRQNINSGLNQLELTAVDNNKDLTSISSQKINEGDRILLVPESKMFDSSEKYTSDQAASEIMIVSKVEKMVNRIVITFEGALTVNRGQKISAFVIGRSFRHFGYNASRKLNKFNGVHVKQVSTWFERKVDTLHAGKRYRNNSYIDSVYYSRLIKDEMPLDQEVKDLASGGEMVCQGSIDFTVNSGSTSKNKWNRPFTLVKRIKEVKVNTLQWGHVEGSSTIVKFDSQLVGNTKLKKQSADVRKIVFHEVLSPKLTLNAPSTWTTGNFNESQLQYFGTYQQAKALINRQLLFAHRDTGTTQTTKITTSLSDLKLDRIDNKKDSINKWMWSLTLSQQPLFLREDFRQSNANITVYGNLVRTDQGKTESEVVLGSGDYRVPFQTFKIQKAPLTFLLDESQTPAQVPELKLYIEGILWKQVDTLFSSRADDAVYIVRQDIEGDSWVQFGDGKTGARLPSGNNNVIAVFRTGNAAAGFLEGDSKPKATGKLKELEDTYLPGEVVGGAEAEDEDKARIAAPGKLQSLGRIVSLADFEAEALAVPSVEKVRADWVAPLDVPLIRAVVLTKSSNTDSLNRVRNILMTYNRCRGPARYPILVESGNLHYIRLKVRVGYSAAYRPKDIKASVKSALGSLGDEANGIYNKKGLLAWQARRFAQDVHDSQIIGVIQQITGVTWVEVDALQKLDLGELLETDPLEFSIPLLPIANTRLSCERTRILVLHTKHLELSMVLDEVKRECKA